MSERGNDDTGNGKTEDQTESHESSQDQQSRDSTAGEHAAQSQGHGTERAPSQGQRQSVADQPAQTQPVQGQSTHAQPQQGQPRTQPQGQPPQGTGTGGSTIDDIAENIGDAETRAAQYGTVAFGILGFGYFFYEFLTNLLGSGASTGGIEATARVFPGVEEQVLFVTVAEASSAFLDLVPLVAIGLAVYYHWTDDVRQQLKTTAISVATGVSVVGFSFLVMAILFAPDGFEVDFGTELVGLIGVAAGSVGLAAGVSLFLQEDPLDLT